MYETEKYRFAGKLNDTVDELTSRRVDELVVKSVDIIINKMPKSEWGCESHTCSFI